jgi:hypothetical protein
VGQGQIVAALFGPRGRFASEWRATAEDERAISEAVIRRSA